MFLVTDGEPLMTAVDLKIVKDISLEGTQLLIELWAFLVIFDHLYN